MNGTSPVTSTPTNPMEDVANKRFTRTFRQVKETKGTFKYDEEVVADQSVLRSFYIEKWTQARGHQFIRVTVELL